MASVKHSDLLWHLQRLERNLELCCIQQSEDPTFARRMYQKRLETRINTLRESIRRKYNDD